MNAGTPKDTKFNLTINNKTPSQKSTEEKDKNDKNNFQTNNNKKTPLPNFVDRNEINEKNFPQKANFFNEKMNSIKSPIIDYFSPSFYLQKYNSPEEIIHQSNEVYSNKSFNTGSVELNFKKSPNINEQNFNFSPSNIFNNNNNNNLIQNSSSTNSQNNIKIQNEKSNEDEESGTLQERIGILLGKNEPSNNNTSHNTKNNMNNNNGINPLSNMGNMNINFFSNNNNMINNNMYNNNINNDTNNANNNNQQNEEEYDNQGNQDEVYILNLNSEDENDKDIDDDILNNNQEKNGNKNNNNNINKKTENEKNNFQKKIGNNIKEQLNNIINTGENEFPSYGGAICPNQNKNQNLNNNNLQNQQNMAILNNINNTTNNIFYPTMSNNIIYSPMNFSYMPYGYFNNNQNMNQNMNNNNNNYYPQKIGQFMNMAFVPNNNHNNNFNNYRKENNKFTNVKQNNNINHFYYNGDQYQINNNRNPMSNKKEINNYINLNQKDKNIYTIGPKDLVVTITSNKKKIKRVNPNAYLNESYEYLSHNIFILSKDQAGCRYLQKKIEKEPKIATDYFYEAMKPYLPLVMKDPFGNYLIQKIIKNLDEERIKKILEIISPSIIDIGINNHGTRVIQFLITFLTTKDLQDYFIEIIKPHTIQLLKELNGAHIIQKVLLEYPDSCDDINKIIIDNCSYLAAHRHGCCVLQKFFDGNYKKLQGDLINNLINNCLVLITDQYGNYVIQSILSLKNDKINSEVAKKINDNIAYYSKHRYSSNVVEKCFDLCNELDKKNFVEKLSPPEIVAELILDDHGNYVIQKVLQCADEITRDNMLKNLIPLIPRIKEVSFGEKLLNRLFISYPQLNIGNNLNMNSNINNNNFKKKFHKENNETNNEQEKNYKNRKNKK